MSILKPALRVIDPRPPIRVIDWAMQYGFTENGLPYNDFAYPHLSAPGGPFDAFDCEQIFDIWLQWASRLGKTFGGQTCMLKQADCDPCPMMFASADEKLAVEVVERTYGMISHCPQLAELLPPPNRRRQAKIDFRFCRVYVAWSRSVSTLADKAARVIHSNEVDKWEHQSTSREADPFKLADERAKEFPTFKRWKEGTPQEKGSSRIERGRLASCNALLYVPCVHCWGYQPLDFGREDSVHGVKWDRSEAGRSNSELAKRTGRYVCAKCEGILRDEHRGTMMRLGVWVPEGCGVNDAEAKRCAEVWRQPGRERWKGWKASPWITGTPLRDGRDWGSRLSSLYALSLSWGDVAREFVASKDKPYELRNFKNSWLAETWEHIRRETTWEQLGGRVISKEITRGVVPNWASVITIGIDRQQDNGSDRFPWVIDAWGPEYRSATIAYGQAETFAQLKSLIVGSTWEHADKGPRMKLRWGLFDSGFLPKGVDEFCHECRKGGVPVFPCKGSSTAMQSTWSEGVLGPRTSRPGEVHYMVDTSRTQLWIEGQVRSATKDDAQGYSLYSGSLFEHQDFLEQLLNDHLDDSKQDRTGNIRESWCKVDESKPNDYRACRRYSYAAMLIGTRGAPIMPRSYTPPPAVQQDESRFRIREHHIRR